MKLLLPREHGAWGILLVPFLTAAAIAGGFNFGVALALMAALLAFLARTPLEFLLVPAQRRLLPEVSVAGAGLSAALFGGGALAAAAALALGWGLTRWLLGLGSVTLALFVLHLLRARRGAAQGWAASFLATGALTLSAPLAWLAARGGLDLTGVSVWLLNLAFFASGLVYVRMRIRALGARTPAGEAARLVWAFHLGVLGLAVTLALLRWASPLVVLPFGLAAARAAWGTRQFGQRFALRQLGWTEVAHSVVFAALLVAAFRL